MSEALHGDDAAEHGQETLRNAGMGKLAKSAMISSEGFFVDGELFPFRVASDVQVNSVWGYGLSTITVEIQIAGPIEVKPPFKGKYVTEDE